MTRAARSVSVWVDGWQTACCGTPFAVGGPVDWSVSDEVDRAFLSRVTSSATADRVDCREEHHDEDEPLRGVSGIVRSIRAASCGYELEGDGGGSRPAAGSGRLHEVTSSSERPSLSEGEGCPGWIVELEPDIGERRGP